MRIVEQYLKQLNTKKLRFRYSVVFLAVLSLLVIVTVSWNLRQTGIAIANDACCGYEEHLHTDACTAEEVLICDFASEESTEAPTTEPTVEITEPSSEETTEAPVEALAEATDVPAEDATEAPVAAAAETEETSVIEEIVNVIAEVFASDSPLAQASETANEPTEPEHIHTEECYETRWSCGLEEHIHELSCYSNVTADLEDWETWSASIPELTGRVSEDIVLVAQSQLGCKESETNFALDADGITQNGITRYGQWYGNPYGPWSNMFTSFCLRFAGLSNAPINSGAAKMQMEWEKADLYRHAGGYEPVSGDIIFFDKNQNGTPESTGVVVRYFDFILTVIEGDVNNAVVQQEYRIDDPVITGYGITNAANRVMMFAAGAGVKTLGVTTSNSPATGTAGTFLVYTISGGKYYAIDSSGNAVEVQISNTGVITADVENPDSLYWTFTKNNNSNTQYRIQNVYDKTKYLYPTSGGSVGTLNQVTTLTSVNANNSTARFRGAAAGTGRNNYYYAQLAETAFNSTTTQNTGATFYFAQTQFTLWLDGTNGGLMSYRSSENTKWTVSSGSGTQLPSEWTSPSTYQYKLVGWVDIYTGEYYEPGAMISVTKDTVLYADWVPATYDIGQNNSHAVTTSSTSDFITTYLFDYNSLINLHSTKLTSDSTLSASTHSEEWTHVASGDATIAGQTTLNFSFVDDDWNAGSAYDGKLDDPIDRTTNSQWTGEAGGSRPGILGPLGSNVSGNRLVTTLFGTGNAYDHETGEGIIGKIYLGTGDHLFQYDEESGYYYYDADLNAASYNKSEQRFYIYDYLERSSDSPGNNSDSDFLPLNSPYANTGTGGVKLDETTDPDCYEYDARKENISPTRVEWLYGMRTDINFGLPDNPGSETNGNVDINGEPMIFKFTGDDDVWILIDGKLVLDLGGIHLATEGEIDFSTGVVTTTDADGNKVTSGNLADYGITAGEHVLSVLYLERGASMANCAIHFNLAPRFAIQLRKEDVLTHDTLDGAVFEFYHDQACTQPCELWTSYQAYKNKEEATNSFEAHDGEAFVWGLSPSQTYYIKEASSPGGKYNEVTLGVIKITLSKKGLNSYGATILPEFVKDEDGKLVLDDNGNPIEQVTNGFTVHGFRVDEEEQTFYLNITNAQNWVTSTTSVYVEKKWNDTKNHDADAVTVYLYVTDIDGTVRKIREIELSKENDWNYTWSNLPMYHQDPVTGEQGTIEMVYSVEEAYVSKYEQSIRPLESNSEVINPWAESTRFENGGDYLLKIGNNSYLSVNDQGKLSSVNETNAKTSAQALWRATVSSNLVKLTNLKTGRSINLNVRNNKPQHFNTTTGSSDTQNLTQSERDNGIVLSQGNSYVGTLSNGSLSITSKESALLIIPVEKRGTADFDGTGYRITNTPVSEEISLMVTKQWDHPFGDDTSVYDKHEVTFRLYRKIEGTDEDPVDLGRTVTVDAHSEWTATFTGLAAKDPFNRKYIYSVKESWETDDWISNVGEMTLVEGTTNVYQTIVINEYQVGDAIELPSTGGIGHLLSILIGLILISAPFVYGLRMRRRYRKGARR